MDGTGDNGGILLEIFPLQIVVIRSWRNDAANGQNIGSHSPQDLVAEQHAVFSHDPVSPELALFQLVKLGTGPEMQTAGIILFKPFQLSWNALPLNGTVPAVGAVVKIFQLLVDELFFFFTDGDAILENRVVFIAGDVAQNSS